VAKGRNKAHKVDTLKDRIARLELFLAKAPSSPLRAEWQQKLAESNKELAKLLA